MSQRKSLRSQQLARLSSISSDSESDSEYDTEERFGRWIGEPHKVEGGRVYYNALSKNEIVFRIGDAVTIYDGDSSYYVGIIEYLYEKNNRSKAMGEKYLQLIWFTRAFAKRMELKKDLLLPDRHLCELYMTPGRDENLTSCVLDKVNVYNEAEFFSKFPKGISPKNKRLLETNFFVRKGVNMRAKRYTENIDWSEYRENIKKIKELVWYLEEKLAPSLTSAKRKRAKEDDYKFYSEEDDDSLQEAELLPSDDDEFGPSPFRDTSNSVPKTPRRRKKKAKASSEPSSTLTTPRRSAKKPLQITPLPMRVMPLNEFQGSPHKKARALLHVSAIPNSLEGRDKEFTTIFSSIESALEEGTGACLYISGTPGTGKTATVHEVIWSLQDMATKNQITDFTFCEINGMKVTTATQAYAQLWESLTGDRVTPKHAMELLDKRFTLPSPNRNPCVVLMDELDQLVTHNQKVLYNFFNWPSLPHSRLIVVAIANTMDLPERVLTNRISSRLGLSRITFEPYNHMQLERIISSRLELVKDELLFTNDSIQFAARKVAAISGDARRALDICRRASELAENKNCKVTPNLIYQAILEMTTSPLQSLLKSLSFVQKVLVCAVVNRMRRSGFAESFLCEVMDEAERLKTTSEKFSSSSVSQTRKADRLQYRYALSSLVESGIFLIDGKQTRHSRVRLAIGDEEVKMAFRDDSELRGIA
ncbi:origin recognition complex subunit Orc1 [Schizosaccharomyces japonicus yFS275]|uniref:Origin recognition complex subunit 1 n=1 Tax=Schizosaccharomyces japonicus (strain yFS275 / FY16936) TaxID=402676 RepID=B6K5F2_SCHJY|nr:origin recognition complex subunit Orc1 [Schizosaccharomyces japonicus yFS275]EEB08756.1 origin recognition complex subunit Orc1 [Schizosaccharomyces japonicus yFS275]